MLAVLIPSLLPPPAPFKIFVLLSGVAGITVGRFVMAIAIGRGIRYFGEGLLALCYGDQAMEFLHENSRTVALVLVGRCSRWALVVYVVTGRARRRAKAAN